MSNSANRTFDNGNANIIEIKKLHKEVEPYMVRNGDPVRAFLKLNGLDIEFKVWRMSPFGLELVDRDDGDLIIGSSLDLTLSIGTVMTVHKGIIVITKHFEKNKKLIGIRFYQEPPDKWEGSDRRKSQRWMCSTEFLPNGVCPNPGKFNDFIFFKVIDVSSNGLKIETSMRNKFLVPGMLLNTTITFPTLGNGTVVLKVENANINQKSGKEIMNVGCSFVRPSKLLIELVSQYIFQFGPPITVKELKHNGLNISKFGNSVEFRYVRTKEEYEAVLELRKKAYGEAGKLADESDVADVYDARSRIIIGVYKGKIVASTRLIFNEFSDEMEHESFVKFDSTIPRRDEICEITRVCTHPDFRGADLLPNLLRFVAISVAQSGRRYILGCATDKLLGMYIRIGFKKTGFQFEHKALNNISHTIFLCDVVKVAVGEGVSPIVWNVLWRDVVRYIRDNKVIDFDPISNIRIGIYSLFLPLAKISMWLMKFKSNKKS